MWSFWLRLNWNAYILRSMFFPNDLFPIHDFSHASLWSEKGFVWEALTHLENYLKKFSYKIKTQIPTQVYLENKECIFIGEGTTIDPGVMIQGPCIIGKNCSIRHGAFLRGSVILGDGCVVGHGSELKNTILLNGAKVAHLCYVGYSIVGPNTNLGAGVKCSNLRLDLREVSISCDGKKIKTGLKKLGAIFGEGVQVGCNCVLNPGTVIGKKSEIFPLLNVGGYVPPHSRVKSLRNWTIEPKAEEILQKMIYLT